MTPLRAFWRNPEKATEFWSAVARNNGLKDGTPERTLIKYLFTVKKIRQVEDDFAKKVAYCWNAYIHGRPVHRIPNQDDAKMVIDQ